MELGRVFEILSSLRDDMADALSWLIQVPCIRSAEEEALPPEVTDVLCAARDIATQCGLTYREITPQVGIAEMGEGDEVVGVLLHLDVVPAGADWDHPPFSGVIVDGEVWGRGAQDDKGPAVSALFAARAVLEAGIPLRRRLRVILGTDEETGVWRDMDDYLAHEAPPVMGFVPDGEFPITSGEKGFVNVLIETHGESGEGAVRLVGLSAGERANIVPDRAEARLEGAVPAELAAQAEAFCAEHEGARLTVEAGDDVVIVQATGLAAHGSLPHEGHSALLDLAAFLVTLPLADTPAARMVGLISEVVGYDLAGHTLGIYGEQDFMGHTTVNIGTVAVGAEGVCQAVANIRMPIGLTQADIVAGVRAAAEKYAALKGHEVTVSQQGRGHDPLYVEPDSELVRGLAAAYEQVTGEAAELKSIGGTTFAKAMPNCVAFGAAMESDSALYHKANERVPIDVLERNARIFAAAIIALCSGWNGDPNDPA